MSVTHLSVTHLASITASSQNQETYQRLKMALSLGLRRQIWLAVCDNISFRDRLIQELDTELKSQATTSPSGFPGYSKLVSLDLKLDNPNFLSQIAQ
ncbi:MAG: hypothetical protein F6K10_35445 [Moorea sp. SIO2B7]|nr:hypothetical protein [Moorena sp. SIO2B7]